MGLEIIAEYAESKAILRELRRLGLNYAHGYAISSPQPLEIFKERFARSA